ncbi:MAG: hypothetical protein JXN60_09370 [Lentisphaerae bacterium]|nr:hypothetical protein [Lentisphaerota bacterium]
MDRLQQQPLLSAEKALLIITITAVAVFCLQHFSDNKADVDIWGNLGFVTELPWSSDFHRVNTYSYTEPDHQWINHEWLGQYLLRKTFDLSGNTGLLLLKILLGFSVVGLINIAMRSDCRHGAIRFFYIILIISTMGYGFSTRPHHFTYLMYAAFLLLLKKYPHNSFVLLIALPIMGCVWANLHGAFFIGLLLLLFQAGGRLITGASKKSIQKSAKFIFCSAALFVTASLVNPYGTHLWEFLLRSAIKLRPHLTEWAPFNPVRDFYAHPDFIALSLLTMVAIGFSKAKRDTVWLTVLTTSFVGALLMRRNIPLFAITAGFTASAHLDNVAGDKLSNCVKRIPRLTLLAFMSALLILSAYYTIAFNKTRPLEIEVPKNQFPVHVVEMLRINNINGNALVFFDWAEYCIWKLYPNCRVFMDGRFMSAYSSAVINDYLGFFAINDTWENALNNYDTDIVLIRRDDLVFDRMTERNDWTLAYLSDVAALFLKNDKHQEFFGKIRTKTLILPSIPQTSIFP